MPGPITPPGVKNFRFSTVPASGARMSRRRSTSAAAPSSSSALASSACTSLSSAATFSACSSSSDRMRSSVSPTVCCTRAISDWRLGPRALEGGGAALQVEQPRLALEALADQVGHRRLLLADQLELALGRDACCALSPSLCERSWSIRAFRMSRWPW